MKLQYKITISIVTIITFVLCITSIVSIREIQSKMREKTEQGLKNTAIAVSSSEIIKDNLGKSRGMDVINNYTEKIRLKTGVHFITVVDMDKKRYSHPLPEEVGKCFEGNDIEKALVNSDTYVTEGKGKLGESIRAFSPVMKDGTQIGVVCVGVLKGDITEEYMNFIKNLIPYIICIGVVAIIGAIILAIDIKKTIFGLEPLEIAMLLKEREIILNTINDGLIMINSNEDIAIINKKAMNILNLKDTYINNSVDILTEEIAKTLKEVLKNNCNVLNLEQKIGKNIKIMSNYSVIKDKDKILGAMVTFKNMTEVSELAEELTGVKNLNWDLRAQNHEFMNKLHTISGLIQLEEYDEALDYIHNTFNRRNEVIAILNNIEETQIAALLLAKYNKALEAKINIDIDKKSYLKHLPEDITSQELQCILGNLLENSIDAVKGKKEQKISVSIKQSDKLRIIVKNSGDKIVDCDRKKIFDKGFTTKDGERGYGMYNVKRIIDSVNGKITVQSDDETIWSVEI